MTRGGVGFVRSVWLVSLVSLGAMLLTPSAFADRKVKGSKIIHQPADKDANDFHYIAWQKEKWVWIKDWKVTHKIIAGAGGFAGDPSVAETDHGQGDGKVHGLIVDQDGLFPKSTKVRIDVELTLNKWNTLRWESLYWTYPPGPSPQPAFPDDGFTVSDWVEDPGNPGFGASELTYFNDDAELSFELHNLRYFEGGSDLTFDELWDWYEWADPLDPILLGPGEQFKLGFYGPDPAGSFLYVAADVLLGGGEVVEIRLSHETPEPGTALMLLLTAGLVTISRARQ